MYSTINYAFGYVQVVRGDFRTQNQVKLGETIPTGVEGVSNFTLFPTLRLGNGFYKEKGSLDLQLSF